MYTILIVEDDPSLSQGLSMALAQEDRKLIQARSLAQAAAELARQSFDLILLDLNLPDGSGLELLARLRAHSAAPVLILSANDLETDIVVGLESGADDYITKPFSLAVLRARVNAQLRRGCREPGGIWEFDGFSFDFQRMEFRKKGVPVSLSKTEQKLLRALVENRGTTLSRETLLDRVWTDGAEYVDENALSVTVKRLRDKLEDVPSKPRYLKTVYGIGYVWAAN